MILFLMILKIKLLFAINVNARLFTNDWGQLLSTRTGSYCIVFQKHAQFALAIYVDRPELSHKANDIVPHTYHV